MESETNFSFVVVSHVCEQLRGDSISWKLALASLDVGTSDNSSSPIRTFGSISILSLSGIASFDSSLISIVFLDNISSTISLLSFIFSSAGCINDAGSCFKGLSISTSSKRGFSNINFIVSSSSSFSFGDLSIPKLSSDSVFFESDMISICMLLSVSSGLIATFSSVVSRDLSFIIFLSSICSSINFIESLSTREAGDSLVIELSS